MSGKEVKKICSLLSMHNLGWKLANKEGKVILEEIVDKLYTQKDEESCMNPTSSTYDVDLHNKCLTLTNILEKMKEVVKGIESAHEKALGFEQLCSFSTSTSFNNSLQTSNIEKSFSSGSSATHNASVIELDKSVILSTDLSKWTETLVICYKNQVKINESVVHDICHLKTRDEALFHICAWVVQPGISDECIIAECAIDQTLKACQE